MLFYMRCSPPQVARVMPEVKKSPASPIVRTPVRTDSPTTTVSSRMPPVHRVPPMAQEKPKPVRNEPVKADLPRGSDRVPATKKLVQYDDSDSDDEFVPSDLTDSGSVRRLYDAVPAPKANVPSPTMVKPGQQGLKIVLKRSGVLLIDLIVD